MNDFPSTLQPFAPSAPLPRLDLRRVLLIMVLLAVLPMLLLEWLNYRDDTQEQEQRAGERLQAIAQLLQASQTQTLQGADQLLSALALSPVIRSEDRLQCQNQLEALHRQVPTTYLGLGLIDAHGVLACKSGAQTLGLYQGHLAYFQEAMRKSETVVGTIHTDSGQRRGLLLAHAVPGSRSGDEHQGVVFAILDLQTVAEGLQAVSASVPGLRLQVLEEDGTLLADSHSAGAATRALTPGLPAAGQVGRWQEDHRGEVLRVTQGVSLHERPVLQVAVSTPVRGIHAPLLQALGQRVTLLLLVMLAVAALVWWLGQRQVLRPVGRMLQALGRVEQGDYALPDDPEPLRLREVGQAQQSVVSLVQTLQRQRDERELMLAALQAREADYRQLFADNPQVMYVYDAQSLQLLDANQAAQDYYGMDRADLLQRTLLDIRPQTEHVLLLSYVSHPRPDGATPQLWLHRRHDGEIRHVEVFSRALDFEGRHARLEMVIDVTELVMLRDRDLEAQERLEQQVARRTEDLALSNRELEAFAYSVSHDLRNPLGAVAMFTQLLDAQLGPDQDEQVRHCLRRILQGLRGMQQLIDDLMVLSQVTRRPLQFSPVDLSALARQCLADLRERDPARQVDVHIQDGLHTQGDAHLLRQLMVNLIDNAWKFTSRTPQARMHVHALPPSPGTLPTVVVEDNGAGFDMKFAHKLFLPFERLHGDQEFPGTGVGLAIAQRVVRRHGGQIWAQAQVGQGARFCFSLNPVDTAAAPTIAANTPTTAAPTDTLSR